MKNAKYNVLVYDNNYHVHPEMTTSVNSSYVESLQEFLHNLSLISYDAIIIGAVLYKEDISKIILTIRKMTLVPIIVLSNNPTEKKRELIYAGADCVMDINSSTEELDLHLFSLLRRTKEWKHLKKASETKIVQGKLVINQSHHEAKWNGIEVHLTRQEHNFLYLLASSPRRIYTFEQIYQLVWKDYPVGDIKNIIWCLVKRLRKKLNAIEDGAGNCIVSVREVGYKFELNNENEQQ